MTADVEKCADVIFTFNSGGPSFCVGRDRRKEHFVSVEPLLTALFLLITSLNRNQFIIASQYSNVFHH